VCHAAEPRQDLEDVMDEDLQIVRYESRVFAVRLARPEGLLQ